MRHVDQHRPGTRPALTRTVAVVLTVTVSVLAVATPVFFALWMARNLSLAEEISRTQLYAEDIVRRTDLTTRQIGEGIGKLAELALTGTDPCSDAMLQQMREIDLTSSYIQSMGRVEGTRLVCSSLGRADGDGLELGPAHLVTANGALIRRDFAFDFTPDDSFILVESRGYVAVIHKELPIDTSTLEPDALLGMYMLDDGGVLSARGDIPPQWYERARQSPTSTFQDAGYIVSTRRSERFLIGTLAAIPISYLSAGTRNFALLLVPIGLCAGAVLVFAMLRLARMQLALPAVIKLALKRREFFLVYQPIVDLQSGGIIGAEALIRWRRPGGELVSPDIFIPVAEGVGLIRQLTGRVIQLFADEAQDIFRRYPDFHISINLSAADMQAPETVELLTNLARETHAAPGNIVLEATERSVVDHQQANSILDRLKQAGLRVAIDDFGTGYSSLSALQKLKLDLLKIDKSFIEALGTDAPTSHVVHHIIEMAKDLRLEMVAEGVETEAQAHYLRTAGVQYAQGWLFGKPQPLAELLAALRNEKDARRVA